MKLAVMLVHGIGPIKEDWAINIIKKLENKISCHVNKFLTGAEVSDIKEIIEIESVCWKDVFKKREDQLNEILDQQIEVIDVGKSIIGKTAKILYRIFQKLQNMITTKFIGDIIVYGNPDAQQGVYSKIAQTLDNIAQKIGIISSKVPLTVIAHSLGTIIASDFIYDRQKERQMKSETGFDSRFSLYNLFTVGSPIALFSLRFGSPTEFNRPINVEDEKGRWLNIYDNDDPIGMPLKPLNNAYANAVFKDVKVNAGLYGMSHTAYFNHTKTLDMISCKIALDWIALNKKLSSEEIDKLYCQYDETLCVA